MATRSPLLDRSRVLAVLAVAYGHWIADVFGVVQSGHISPDWGSVETRLAQWRPTSGQGVQGAVSDVMRWAAWLTDSGVGAFLILTGLVLILGVRTEPAAFSSPRATISWYLRRMAATLPAWVFLHFVMLALVSAREGPALIFDYHSGPPSWASASLRACFISWCPPGGTWRYCGSDISSFPSSIWPRSGSARGEWPLWGSGSGSPPRLQASSSCHPHGWRRGTVGASW